MLQKMLTYLNKRNRRGPLTDLMEDDKTIVVWERSLIKKCHRTKTLTCQIDDPVSASLLEKTCAMAA
jgi:hypothetical protein